MSDDKETISFIYPIGSTDSGISLYDTFLKSYTNLVDITELPDYDIWCEFLNQLGENIYSYDRETLTKMWKSFEKEKETK